MIDLRQTPEYAKYMKAIGWKVDRSQGFYAYIKKFPFIGNFIKIQRPEKLSYGKVRNLTIKHRPFQIVIEPKNSSHISLLTTHNFRQSRTYFVPSKTIQIDLTKSEKQLLKEMHYKTRYNIKKYYNLLTTTYSLDISSFADFWQRCALKQRGMFLNNKKEMTELYHAFGKNAHIINVFCHPERAKRVEGSKHNEILRSHKRSQNDKVILAGILLIFTKDTAYYMYAASTDEGKKLFAPTLAAWETIKLAKKLKKKVFDFEGIYDERFPIKSWLGFTRFKKSFGGKIIEYPGTYSKFMLPFKLW